MLVVLGVRRLAVMVMIRHSWLAHYQLCAAPNLVHKHPARSLSAAVRGPSPPPAWSWRVIRAAIYISRCAELYAAHDRAPSHPFAIAFGGPTAVFAGGAADAGFPAGAFAGGH